MNADIIIPKAWGPKVWTRDFAELLLDAGYSKQYDKGSYLLIKHGGDDEHKEQH